MFPLNVVSSCQSVSGHDQQQISMNVRPECVPRLYPTRFENTDCSCGVFLFIIYDYQETYTRVFKMFCGRRHTFLLSCAIQTLFNKGQTVTWLMHFQVIRGHLRFGQTTL